MDIMLLLDEWKHNREHACVLIENRCIGYLAHHHQSQLVCPTQFIIFTLTYSCGLIYVIATGQCIL